MAWRGRGERGRGTAWRLGCWGGEGTAAHTGDAHGEEASAEAAPKAKALPTGGRLSRSARGTTDGKEKGSTCDGAEGGDGRERGAREGGARGEAGCCAGSGRACRRLRPMLTAMTAGSASAKMPALCP